MRACFLLFLLLCLVLFAPAATDVSQCESSDDRGCVAIEGSVHGEASAPSSEESKTEIPKQGKRKKSKKPKKPATEHSESAPNSAPLNGGVGNGGADAVLFRFQVSETLQAAALQSMADIGALVMAGNHALAIAKCRQALAMSPRNAQLKLILAELLVKEAGFISEAFLIWENWFREAHQLPPYGLTAEQLRTSIPEMRSATRPHEQLAVVPHRLRHDLEQIKVLKERQRLPDSIASHVMRVYRSVLKEFDARGEGTASATLMELTERQWLLLGPLLNRALYVPQLPRHAGPVINPQLDLVELEHTYLSRSPSWIAVDDLLVPEVLHAVLTYCEEATIWYYQKPGYLGAYAHQGLATPLLAQIAESLVVAFPHILCDLRLHHAWAYKYDDQILQAIQTHADTAAVNLNFWITADTANLDPQGGGLVVYTVTPPSDWVFDEYNSYDEHGKDRLDQFLAGTGYANVTIPYKQNRLVMFQSDLFHASAPIRFERGFLNRRINLTFLFGNRGQTCSATPSADSKRQ